MSIKDTDINFGNSLLTPAPVTGFPAVKWLALFFGAFSIFGPLYIFALPATMETQILEVFNVNNAQYNLLFTLGGSSNLFMPIVSGFLIDYFGARPILVIANLLVIIAQIIQYQACYSKSFFLLVVGKFIAAATLDALLIARFKIICRMFYDKYLAKAMAFAAIPQKLAIVMNGLLSPYVYDQTGSLADTWGVSVIVAVVSFIFALAFIFFDWKLDKHNAKLEGSLNSLNLSQEQAAPPEPITFSKLKEINQLVWVLAITGGFTFAVFSSLFANLNTMLQLKFGFSTQGASDISLVFLAPSLLMTLAVGVFTDRKGRRAEILLVGVFCMVLSLLAFQLLPGCDGCYTCLIPLGICGMFVGSYLVIQFASVPFLCRKEHIGMAFGIVNLITNCVALPVPLLFGIILDYNKVGSYQSYTEGLYFLVLLAIIGVFSATALVILDHKQGKPLSQLKPEHAMAMNKNITDSTNDSIKEELTLQGI